MNTTPVLVTWVAVNNDPFERHGKHDFSLLVDDEHLTFGPTLTLLCDEESCFAGKIDDVVIFYRKHEGESDRETKAVEELTIQIRKRNIRVHLEAWDGNDPTDHRAIFNFLSTTIQKIRLRFENRELVIHISPGTPSMHTVWVLMAETGFIDPPFTVVKSYRRTERRGRPAVVPVNLGIETFYKAFKSSQPRQLGFEDQSVLWDPQNFRTSEMRSIFTEAKRFAQLKVPVLILGERGTGKTTLASWIRSNSPFKRTDQDAHWPSVACGQYNPETMRAELFGYKKGAFTGATSDKPGLLAAAHQDTLFLDEVGDISVDLQRLLIRAIEEKRYFALGDDKPRESDFRLLTATNIQDRKLRERLNPDFLDRISLLTITLPPLREIPDELDWLWRKVFSEAARRSGVTKKATAINSQHHAMVLSFLKRHPLPGNLRDLFRVAYRILAARNDADEPMSPADSIAYGIESLVDPSGPPTTSIPRSIAEAFAQGAAIDSVIATHSKISTSEIISDFKEFLATELRRIGTQRGVKPSDLCDVTDRSLLEWTSTTQNRKFSSKIRKKSSKK